MIISKDELIRNISRDLSDNSTGQISPYDIRHNLLDIIDSVHLLLEGESINVQNFGTFDVRSTRVGENSIANSQIQNAICEDNSAFGYYSLKSNYQGVRNTALGSYSLSCNVHGEDNIGVGYNSLTSNTAGYANVGIGNSTLKRNKFGNFNVAIGHAAGYYVDPTTNNKLFIASHPVDNQHICDNPLGSGWTPLIYGDLNNSNLVLGVATRNLVTYGDGGGVLQTKGDITPVENNKHNIGSSNYNWDKIYVANEIVFPSGKISYSYQDDSINFNKDILPDDNKVHVLGSENNQWASGHFQDLVVTRKAYITDYESISSCIYNCKTLYLASSFVCQENHPCGHLPDSSLNGAGLVLKSLNRDYEFTFVPQNPFYAYPNMGEPDIFGKSYWSSNISLRLSDSCHIKTRRIVGTNSFSAVDQSNGYGVFLKNKNFYFGPETLLTPFLKNTTPTIAGIGDINFLGKFGTRDDFSVTYGAIEPGTNVSQKFLSNIKTKIGNAINGFELKYFDDTIFYNNDRFTISSFNYSETPVNTITLAKYNGDGVFGINNFNNGGGQDILPETIFNARSKSDSVLRSTAETDQYAKSSLQLLGTDNCLNSGIELAYYSSSGNAEFIYYDNFISESYIQFQKGKKIGLFASSGTMTELLTVGGSGCDKSAVSIHFTDQDTTPNSDIEYGKIFTKEKLINTTQSASLYFMDSSGNVFDLVENKYDLSSGVLYTDENKNTLIGIESNYDRRILKPFNATHNTAIGYHTLNQLASGDGNVCIGSRAGEGLINGFSNIALGYGALSGSNPSIYNSIVIGNNAAAKNLQQDNVLYIGNGDYPIISGDLKANEISPIGANPRRLFIPDDGAIEFQGRDTSDANFFSSDPDSSSIESLVVSHDGFELKDVRGNNYPQNELKFTFTAEESADLLILKHSGEPLDKQYAYEFADSGIPYAQLNGDLRILNAIRFSDNTSLYSASDYKDEIERIDVDVVQVSGIVYDDIYGRLQNAQDEIKSANGSSGIFVEGLALNDIGSASFTSPKSGSIRTRSGNNIVIHNRDKNLEIKIRDYVVAIKIDNEYRPIWVSSDRNVVCCK